MNGLLPDLEVNDKRSKPDSMASTISRAKLDSIAWQDVNPKGADGSYGRDELFSVNSDDSGEPGAEQVLQQVQGLSKNIHEMACRTAVVSLASQIKSPRARIGTHGLVQETFLECHFLESCTTTPLSKEFLKFCGPSLGQAIVNQHENIAAYLEHKSMLTEDPGMKQLKHKVEHVLEENDHVKELMKPTEHSVDRSLRLPALVKQTQKQTGTTSSERSAMVKNRWRIAAALAADVGQRKSEHVYRPAAGNARHSDMLTKTLAMLEQRARMEKKSNETQNKLTAF